jgi:pilus assembly protein Flp/PilA
MIIFVLQRYYKLLKFYGAHLFIYLRLTFHKLFPTWSAKPKPRLQLQRGQGLVEYALVLVLVAVVVIAILTLLGPQVSTAFFKVQCSFEGGDWQESGSFAGRIDCNDDSATKVIFGNTIGYIEPNGNVEWVE